MFSAYVSSLSSLDIIIFEITTNPLSERGKLVIYGEEQLEGTLRLQKGDFLYTLSSLKGLDD